MPLLKTLLEGQALAEAEPLGRTLERFVSGGPPTAPAGHHQDQQLGDAYSQALESLLKTIHSTYAPAPTSGAQLYLQLMQSRLLPTGCSSIDTELLRGGLREGQLVEVFGESASGKTQLCLMTAATTALRGEGVMYIDTSNAFTAERMVGMLRAVTRTQAAVEEALACIRVQRAYDVHAVLGAVDQLLRQHAKQPQDSPKLVVVDSLSAVIVPVLGGGAGQHSQGHALLAGCAAALKCFSARAGAAVLVTNHMVGGGDGGRGEKRAAMGESWKNQAHVRIQLSLGSAAAAAGRPDGSAAGAAGAAAAENTGRHMATLRASTYSASGLQVPYWLAPAGMVAEPPGQARAGDDGGSRPPHAQH